MKALAAALVAAQQDMPAVAPDAVNPHFGNRFVSLDHLIASTKPVLTKHGLSIVQFPSELGGMPALTTVLLHTSGESTQGTTPLILAKQDMQGLGGSITYARRYAWASVLGISAEGDDDGNTASAGGQEGQARSVTPSPREPAPTNSTAAAWTWPFGKHKGKTLAETDQGYLDWFLEKSDKEDIKQLVREYLNIAELEAMGGGFEDGDDIPFDRTIDGLGN